MRTIFAIKDKKTNMYWNRIHKKFMPLCQNTAFFKRPYEPAKKVEECLRNDRFEFFNRDLVIVEIKLVVETEVPAIINKK